MERLLLKKLKQWKESAYRKPLILRGARQVGKTWLLKEFGRQQYQSTAYFNFDEHAEYQQFFATTKDVKRILMNLSMASGQPIEPGKTLVIFDEIQECPAALNTLKYFCENLPELSVACAGSLLGIALTRPASFPVGKVDFLSMGPMNFSEFLRALGDGNLTAYLETIDTIVPLPDAFFNPLAEKLKMYFVTGGMPEAVRLWTETHDTARVEQVLSNILLAYEQDFTKHAEPREYPKLSLIWHSLPSQLARENKKFLYKVVKRGARAREYEDALEWLCNAELCTKVYRSSKPGLPMSAYDDLAAFKVYMLDVGLLRRLSLLLPSAFAEGNRLFVEFKGALTENYILEALKTQFTAVPRYWTDPPYSEVDFLIQRDNDIFPIEVKADTNIKSRSLQKYKEKYGAAVKLRVRFSLQNLCLDDDILNIPLFMADQADRLIGMAMEK